MKCQYCKKWLGEFQAERSIHFCSPVCLNEWVMNGILVCKGDD